MKKIAKISIVMIALAMMVSMVVTVNTYAAPKKAKNKVVYELKKGTLTVKGKGKMPNTMKFEGNKKIKKVVIKKGVTSISNNAFDGCTNLKEVKIANTVKEIGWYSFRSTSIKKITIPKSVKTMGNGVLINCQKLTTITMPGDFKQKVYKYSEDGMFSIMYGHKIKTVNFNTPFNLELCEFLAGTNWNVWKKDPNYKSIDGVIYSKDGKEVVRVPSTRTEITLADGCETFCLQSILYTEYYFDDGYYICCNKLNKITIPESVKKIDDEKYASDVKATESIPLTEIVISSKNLDANSIGVLLKNLKEIGYLDGNNEVNNREKLFQQFSERIKNINGLYILDGDTLLDYVGDESTVIVPEGIKTIAKSAFRGKHIDKIVLPEGLEKIGENAFSSSEIKEINLPSTLRTIESYAFYFAGVKKVEIPSEIRNWGEYVFSYSRVEEAVLPDDMTYIPRGMFYDSALEKVNVPKNLKKVYRDAFYRTKINVQDFLNAENLEAIYRGAFGFTSWAELTIPNNIKKISKYGITSIKEDKKKITVEGTTENYHEDAFCENNEQKTLTVTFKGGIKQAYTDLQRMSARFTKNYKIESAEFKWFKVSDADGYDIKVYSDKKYKNVVKKVTVNKNRKSKTIKFNKKHKKLYVRIRPYKVESGRKVYGRWSSDKIKW